MRWNQYKKEDGNVDTKFAIKMVSVSRWIQEMHTRWLWILATTINLDQGEGSNLTGLETEGYVHLVDPLSFPIASGSKSPIPSKLPNSSKRR